MRRRGKVARFGGKGTEDWSHGPGGALCPRAFFPCLSAVWALGLLFSFALVLVRPPGAKKSFPVGARDSRSVVLTPSSTVKLS